jgi:hypothetical protein
MDKEQELRAWSLEIAAIMLGAIPLTDNLSNRITYQPYIGLADTLRQYIESGVPPKTQ